MIARLFIALGLVAGSAATAFAACGSAVTWIPGRWTVVGCEQVWVSGHYQQIEQTICAPTTTRNYVAGHWDNQGGTWVWISGHYEERVTQTCVTTPVYVSEPVCTSSTTVVVDTCPDVYVSYSRPVVSTCVTPKPAVRHYHDSAVSVSAPIILPPAPHRVMEKAGILPHQVLPKIKDIPLPHEIIKKVFK